MNAQAMSGRNEVPAADVTLATTATTKRWAKGQIARYLRWGGVAVLAVAMVEFLVDGARQFPPAYRHWLLPLMEAVLAALGLLCAFTWKEVRGGRVFFALATALLPLQASQIGSLWFDRLHGARAGLGLRWLVTDGGTGLMGISILLALGLFLPVAYLGFSILAREQARRLLLLLCAGSLLLILPGRGAAATCAVLGSQWLLMRLAHRAWFDGEGVFAGLEGTVARAMLWLPLAIAVGRSFFYPLSEFVIATQLLLLGLSLSAWRCPGFAGNWLEPLGLGILLLGWLTAVDGLLAQDYARGLNRTLLTCLPPSLYLLCRPGEQGLRPLLRRLGAAGACVGALLALCQQPGHGLALLSMLTGVLVGGYGYEQRERAVFAIGAAGFVLGLGYYLRYAVDLYQANHWLSLTLLGVLAILSASFLERKRTAGAGRLGRLLRHPRGWR